MEPVLQSGRHLAAVLEVALVAAIVLLSLFVLSWPQS